MAISCFWPSARRARKAKRLYDVNAIMARIAMTRSTTMSSRRVKPRGREDDRLISVLTVQYTPGPAACSGDGYAGRCAIGAQLGNLSREQRRAAAQARRREERSGTCRT